MSAVGSQVAREESRLFGATTPSVPRVKTCGRHLLARPLRALNISRLNRLPTLASSVPTPLVLYARYIVYVAAGRGALRRPRDVLRRPCASCMMRRALRASTRPMQCAMSAQRSAPRMAVARMALGAQFPRRWRAPSIGHVARARRARYLALVRRTAAADSAATARAARADVYVCALQSPVRPAFDSRRIGARHRHR
jgi:hypothetical protein